MSPITLPGFRVYRYRSWDQLPGNGACLTQCALVLKHEVVEATGNCPRTRAWLCHWSGEKALPFQTKCHAKPLDLFLRLALRIG